MSKLEVEMEAAFEFEIGELVFFKGAAYTSAVRPKQFIVQERLVQQCDGGIQLLYKLGMDAAWRAEILLTRDEPPYRPESGEYVADHLRINTALDAERNRISDLHWQKREDARTERKKDAHST